MGYKDKVKTRAKIKKTGTVPRRKRGVPLTSPWGTWNRWLGAPRREPGMSIASTPSGGTEDVPRRLVGGPRVERTGALIIKFYYLDGIVKGTTVKKY